MTEAEMETAEAELDRLINDPDVRMDPERVWLLADNLSRMSGASTTAPVRVGGRAKCFTASV